MIPGPLPADAPFFETIPLISHQRYRASMNEIIPFSFYSCIYRYDLIYLLLTFLLLYFIPYSKKLTLTKI